MGRGGVHSKHAGRAVGIGELKRTWRHLQHAVRVCATRWGEPSCVSSSGLSQGYGPGTGGRPGKRCGGGNTDPND